MLPTHELVATHKGYEIYQRKPGFEFTPMTLRKIASFIVRAEDGHFAVFAFAYSILAPLDGEEVQEEGLLANAIQVIQRFVDEDNIQHHHEYTFEYRAGACVEVTNPAWWIKTYA